MLEVCSERSVSVLLKLESMGYPTHGHDLLVELCYCPGPSRIDVEEVDRALREILEVAEYRLLDEVVGVREAMIEDLLDYILKKAPSLGGSTPCKVTARWRSRRITLYRRPPA